MLIRRPDPRAATAVIARDTDASNKFADYICDGVDDDVQIQAAIDAIAALGGGKIIIRAGSFTLGNAISLQLKHNIVVEGEGIGATILQAKAAFPTNHGLFENTSLTNNFEATGFTLDGNKANQTTQNISGFDMNGGTGFCVHHCEIENMNNGTGYGNGIYTAQTMNKIYDNYIHDNETAGINYDVGIGEVFSNRIILNGAYGINLSTNQVRIYDNEISSNTLSGILVNAAQDVHITGNHITLNTVSGILFSNGPEWVSVIGNIIMSNGKDQIDLGGAGAFYCIVNDNVIDCRAGLDADNTWSGILIRGSSSQIVVKGNVVYGNGATNDLKYGIREATNGDDFNIIVGNVATGCDTANISSLGVNSDVSHNITV